MGIAFTPAGVGSPAATTVAPLRATTSSTERVWNPLPRSTTIGPRPSSQRQTASSRMSGSMSTSRSSFACSAMDATSSFQPLGVSFSGFHPGCFVTHLHKPGRSSFMSDPQHVEEDHHDREENPDRDDLKGHVPLSLPNDFKPVQHRSLPNLHCIALMVRDIELAL